MSEAPVGSAQSGSGQCWEAVMGGKYSAEWWEKIANINSDASKQRDDRDRISLSLQSIPSGTAARLGEAEELSPPTRLAVKYLG
jgi:hypothetical protein